MLIECAGCREPLFADAATCSKCGLANPAYEEPRWHRVVPILAVVIVGFVAAGTLGLLGLTAVSVVAGAVVLRNNGFAAILAWVGGSAVIGVICFLIQLLPVALPVSGVLLYAVFAMPLLVWLSQMKP